MKERLVKVKFSLGETNSNIGVLLGFGMTDIQHVYDYSEKNTVFIFNKRGHYTFLVEGKDGKIYCLSVNDFEFCVPNKLFDIGNSYED